MKVLNSELHLPNFVIESYFTAKQSTFQNRISGKSLKKIIRVFYYKINQHLAAPSSLLKHQ